MHNQLKTDYYQNKIYINAPRSWSHKEYIYAVVLIFWHSEVAWVLVSSGSQVQLQIILDPDYLSVSYGYAKSDSHFRL